MKAVNTNLISNTESKIDSALKILLVFFFFFFDYNNTVLAFFLSLILGLF